MTERDVTEGDREPGPVEAAALRELDALSESGHAFRGTLTEMVVRLARAYDRYEGMDLSKLSRLNQELRATLVEVARGEDDSDDGAETARLSTPVFDTEDTGPADVGPEGGGGGGAVGQAADAAPAGNGRRSV